MQFQYSTASSDIQYMNNMTNKRITDFTTIRYNEYVNFEKEYPEQIHRMRKELPDIKEDDNPCIVVYFL